MKKVIIITGKEGTGKTTKANELTQGLKSITLHSIRHRKRTIVDLMDIRPEHEAVIIEGVEDIVDIGGILFAEGVWIEKQLQEQFYYKFKLVVITSQTLSKKDFSAFRGFEFIELTEKFI